MIEFAERAQAVFLNALDISSPEVRCAYIDAECRDDESLRREVEELLDHADRVGDFLGEDPVEMEQTTDGLSDKGTSRERIPQAVGQQIGPYKIREKIAEGGMGSVYVAEQSEPVRRKVALKLIRPGMAGPNVVARFEAERQALAMMDHPNIARVLDGGATEDQLPYFVMELVQGLSITEYCDAKQLSTRERLELFVDVCRAIQHAHQKGIIHRDLKPSNILVAQIDDSPVPKVIDFGVAKALHQKLTDETIYTQFSQLVGTPLYMSPEQADLGVVDVDTRSDVYSLGVVLYEMLTGETPFDRDTLKNATFDEMRRIIREDEPKRPSAMVSTLKAEAQSTVAEKRGVDARKLQDSLTGELDWLVMKTLEKDRSRRYESASALAEDVRRYLDDEPVEACPPSIVYRTKKYVARNRAIVLTASIILLASLSATCVSAWYAIQANEARKLADQRLALSQADFDRATGAVDMVLDKLSSEEFARMPGIDPVRHQLIDEALEIYDAIQQDHGKDRASRERKALALIEIADMCRDSRYIDKATHALVSAIQTYEKLVEEHPQDPKLKRGLSYAYNKRAWGPLLEGGTEERTDLGMKSIALLEPIDTQDLPGEDALGIRRNLASAYGIVSNNLLTLGQPEKALAYAFKGLELQKQIREPRKEIEAYSGLSNIQRELGQLAAAENSARHSARIAREQVEARQFDYQSGRSFYFSLRSLYEALQTQGKQEAAKEIAIEQLQLAKQLAIKFPNAPPAYGWVMGSPLTDVDRLKEFIDAIYARSHYNAIQPLVKHSRAPQFAELILEMRRTGATEDAEELARDLIRGFSELIDSRPDDDRLYFARCLLHAVSQNTEDAMKDLKRLVELDRDRAHYARKLNSFAWRMVTVTGLERPDAELATTLAEQAIELAPLSVESWNTLGVSQFRTNDFSAAIVSLNKAIELDPSGKSLGYNAIFLAMAHWRLGKKDEARRLYDKAIAWMEVNDANQELRQFRSEAEQLLGRNHETVK